MEFHSETLARKGQLNSPSGFVYEPKTTIYGLASESHLISVWVHQVLVLSVLVIGKSP